MTQQSGVDIDQLIERVLSRPTGGGRVLIGIAGLPGAGKTTVAVALVDALVAAGVRAVHVPMDGFHLADVALDALGRRDRKGAVDTFDGEGYLALLTRLREDRDSTVWAPAFERDIEQPVAGSIPVPPETEIVVSEGNYLLVDIEPWPRVRAAFDEVWFVDVDDALRRERLTDRHIRFGKSPAEAIEWVDRVDDVNARLIAAARETSDLIVRS